MPMHTREKGLSIDIIYTLQRYKLYEFPFFPGRKGGNNRRWRDLFA